MYFRLMGKLNARRNGLLAEDEKGFTLIELLVVVIIIGILAAIAIPVYLGVQNNAKDSATKSDIANLKTAIVASQTANNGTLPAVTSGTDQVFASLSDLEAFPSTSPDDLKTAGASFSDNTSKLTYTPGTGSAFCIVGVSDVGSTHEFYATDSSGVAKAPSTLPSGCTAP